MKIVLSNLPPHLLLLFVEFKLPKKTFADFKTLQCFAHKRTFTFVSASLLCPARECICVFATLDRLEAMADSQARHRQHKRAANLIYIILHREFIIITRRGRVGPVHSTFRLTLPLSKAWTPRSSRLYTKHFENGSGSSSCRPLVTAKICLARRFAWLQRGCHCCRWCEQKMSVCALF